MTPRFFGVSALVTLWFAFSSATAATATERHYVFIGDSHSAGSFGAVFTEWFRSSSQTFKFVASGGSAPLQWLNGKFVTSCGYADHSGLAASPPRRCVDKFRTPTLKSLLADANALPDVINKQKVALVALGTNYGMKPEDQAWQIRSTVDLARQVSEAGFECVWIGPPNMPKFGDARLEKHYDLIRTALKQAAVSGGATECRLIDSRPLSEYPSPADPANENPDYLHYDFPMPWWHFPEGTAAAREWASRVIHQLQ